MKYNSGCIVCGKELIYREDNISVKCEICNGDFKTNVVCKENHYICDSCHSKDGFSIVEEYCITTEETNPILIANTLMKDSRINLHGPEHHFIVPASLITSYYNVLDEANMKERQLALAKERSSTIKGGMCGFYGTCGAAIGAGIFASIITGASPLSEDSWGYGNMQTGHILMEIGKVGGPRCCKRNTYISIIEASRFLDQNKGIKLFDYDDFKVVCQYKSRNKQCIKLRCPYFLNK